MSLKSVASLSTSVLRKPRISREHLSRYSWLPDILRIEGSIITGVIGPVLTITIFATGVAYAWHKGKNITLTNSVTPLLGVVVGLILVFRNSTSYDRYYEGRKDFGSMMSNIRNLTRLAWINVNLNLNGVDGDIPAIQSHLRRKKIKFLKLCVSYAYAVKHHLRNEPGVNHGDLIGLLPSSITRVFEGSYDRSFTPPGTTSSPVEYESNQNQNHEGEGTHQRVRIQDSLATLPDQHTPLLSDSHRTVEFHAYADQRCVPLPIIIAHELTRTIYEFKREGYLDTVGPAGANAMNQLVQGMIDQLTSLERVANTPIPVSYRIHLKQCVSLYLFALPFTLVRDLEWRMIPIVTVVAFTLMGIEGIADQIEMPFGRDKNDLPLDQFCAELKDEIEYTIQRLPEGGYGLKADEFEEGDD